jgi:ribosomal protein S18 acetylase RimI-like enzyme
VPMMNEQAGAITYCISPPVGNEELNMLFAAAWSGHTWRNFAPILAHSLAYVCAWQGNSLVGFVNLATDGGIHAFLLDTTVHPAQGRRGVGRRLVALATEEARRRGIQWLHVDYEAQLEPFYRACGFQVTAAGLLAL